MAATIDRYGKEKSRRTRYVLPYLLVIALQITTGHYSMAASFQESSRFPQLDSMLLEMEQLNPEDTLYGRALLRVISYLRVRDTDLAIKYAQHGVEHAREINDPRLEGLSLNMLGICFGMQGRYVEAIPVFEETTNIARKLDYARLLALAKMNLGIQYKSLNDFPRSIAYYQEAWTLFDSMGSTQDLARISNNLGNLYSRNDQNKEAAKYYREAQEIYSQLGNTRGFASAQLNRGLLYLHSDEMEKAQDQLDSALSYAIDHSLTSEEVLALTGLGELYYLQKTYELAEYYLNSAYEKALNLNMRQSQYSVLSYLALVALDRNELERSQNLIQEAAAIADSLQNLGSFAELAQIQSSIYEQRGDLDRALQAYKDYTVLHDSLTNLDLAEKYQNLQMQFDVDLKNRLLENQEMQLELLSDNLSLQTRWKWMLAALSGLLLLLGILYYQKFVQRRAFAEELKNRNSQISSQKEEIDHKNRQLEQQYILRKKIDDTINRFATYLGEKNTVDGILLDIADKCIQEMGFTECITYTMAQDEQVLIPTQSKYSSVSIDDQATYPSEIPLGEGVIGSTAIEAQLNVTNDAVLDQWELAMQKLGKSHLVIPLVHQGGVIGVLHGLHEEAGFITDFHIDSLRTISAIASSKVAQIQALKQKELAELAQLEAAKIKELEEIKSRLFANVSHEFRTPLHLILAPLQKENGNITAGDKELMGRNAHRLLRLVNQLLDLTKIEHGELQLEKQRIEIFSCISEISQGFIPLAEQKKIQYQIDIPERDYIAEFDPDAVEKILYNVISNAFKFTPENGKVSVHLSHRNRQIIQLTVSDTGIGIDENGMQKIYDRFYQGDAAETRQFSGTGIGLALTRELIDLMQGDIHLDSEVGKGSIFTIVLPLPAVEGIEVEKHPVYSIRNHQEEWLISDTDELPTTVHPNADMILLVEDHPEMRSHLRQELSGQFNVIEAENGARGLEMARKNIPDLIISDVMMPIMDGISMTRKLRDHIETAHIPIILLTARDDHKTRVKGFETGIEQYLTKPFDPNELKARINSLLKYRERIRNKYQKLGRLPLTEIEPEERDTQFLESLITTIEDNLENESFSVQDLQKAVGMSRMQLHRKLKALLNQSASEFIRTIRLQHAAQYLNKPGYQISEVAYRVGFNHMSYFAKCFKDQFGVLPSEYVKTA